MQSKRRVRWTWLTGAGIVALVMLVASAAAAEVPLQFQYQGQLVDDDGQPITGETTLQFSIYDAETEGSILWGAKKTVQLGSQGQFSTTLGSPSNPIEPGVVAGGERWLSITLDSGVTLEPRLPLKSVPYSLLASRAEKVADGAIDRSSLSSSLRSELEDAQKSPEWSDITDKPDELADGDDDTLGELTCQSGYLAEYDGNQWTCASPTTYDGQDFATSDQQCGAGKVAVGIDSSGDIICEEDQDTTYGGTDFATSDQGCNPGAVVTGVDANGNVTCTTDQHSTYDGTDFATSDQGCNPGEVVTGVDANGDVTCASDQDTTYSGGSNVSVSGTTINTQDNWVDEGGDSMSGALDMQGRDIENVGALNPGVGVNRECVRWDSDGDPYSREDGFSGSGTMNTLNFPDKKGQLIFVQASYSPGDWGSENDSAYMWVQVDGKRVTNKLPQVSDSDQDGNMNTGNSVMGFYVGDGGSDDVIEQYKDVVSGDMSGDGWATLCAFGLPVGGG